MTRAPTVIAGHTLTLDAVTHRFGSVLAVDDVSLEVSAGDLVALLGPSGCGKTTLLRVIAGFVTPTAGRVLVDGEPVDHLPPHRRGIGIVFQNYALFPHMTVGGVKATLACLVLGYPLAWVTAHARPGVRALLTFVVILPLLTSVVVRTFAWIVILGRQGVLNKTLLALGLLDEPARLLFSEPGVVVVLAQVQLPLMVLPLLTTFQRMDPNLADASAALGAGRWRTFWKVIAPLSLPGVIAGVILVYAACVTAFVTQTLIGGARLVYMPLFMYQQATGAQDWPFAAAASIVFMVAVLFVVFLLNLLARTRRAQLYA